MIGYVITEVKRGLDGLNLSGELTFQMKHFRDHPSHISSINTNKMLCHKVL